MSTEWRTDDVCDPDEQASLDTRLDEALRFLGRAWELDRNPEIAAHLGEVLWFSDRREEALSIWREGADIDPDNAVLRETLERLGVTL